MAGLVDPLQEESNDPWKMVGPKGKAVSFSDEPGGDWPLAVSSLELNSAAISPTPIKNSFAEFEEAKGDDNDAQPAPTSSSAPSSSSWLAVEKDFDSYEEQAWREMEQFRADLDDQEAAREAILQANGIEAKRIRAAERRKQRLLGEALRSSSELKEQLKVKHAAAEIEKTTNIQNAGKKQIIRLGSRSATVSSEAHHHEPWVVQSAAAQQAIAGGCSCRQGAHGPEGPGFTRLPMV